MESTESGSRLWANAVLDPIRSEDNFLVGFITITRDIAERMPLQETARESEAPFRMLVKGMVDCAIYLLDRQGHITSWNSGAQAIAEYEEAEIIGQHFSPFYTRRTAPEGFRNSFWNRIREGMFEARRSASAPMDPTSGLM